MQNLPEPHAGSARKLCMQICNVDFDLNRLVVAHRPGVLEYSLLRYIHLLHIDVSLQCIYTRQRGFSIDTRLQGCAHPPTKNPKGFRFANKIKGRYFEISPATRFQAS